MENCSGSLRRIFQITDHIFFRRKSIFRFLRDGLTAGGFRFLRDVIL